MICEAQRQTRIEHLPKGAVGHVWLQGQQIAIVRTACNLGGTRPWFLCPTCGRRCAVLYPVNCRLCLGLRYAVEHEGIFDRRLRKAIRHREKYGQNSGGICVAFPAKPKWIRWHTFFKAKNQASRLDAAVIEVLPT